jgi:NAD(P)-dependent dehydrogenase (short-subunit alcohol dehydrogenase family)
MQQIPGSKGVRAAWQTSYDVNVTSTQVFTMTFIPLLIKSKNPRLLFVTSGLSSLTTCAAGRETALTKEKYPPAGWPKPPAPGALTYRSSKTALNMLMLEWHRILHHDNVKVWAISPGFLATGLGGMGKDVLASMGAGNPSQGGEFITKVVEGERNADAGKVIDKNGVQPW